MSTTIGLAGAFNQKAQASKTRENIWIGVLVVALSAAGAIAFLRYNNISEMVSQQVDVRYVVVSMLIAIFGVSAPLWLAWVATRMLSRNFAVTEDYSYKASLAKAYVGFREEAKDMDEIFQQRLFAAAITQLDASPVRLLGGSSHPASPLQDLMQQPFIQELLKDEKLHSNFVDWFKRVFQGKAAALIPVPAPRSATFQPTKNALDSEPTPLA